MNRLIEKTAANNGWESQSAHAFLMRFSSAKWDALSWAAQRSNLDRSDLIRRLVMSYVARLKAFESANPEAPRPQPEDVLAAYYKSGEIKMQAEWAKAAEQLAAYHRQQEIDGGLAAVDYQAAPKVMAFAHRCWAKGISWKVELAAMEQALSDTIQRLDARSGYLNVEVDAMGNLRPELDAEPPRSYQVADPMRVKTLTAANAYLADSVAIFKWAAAIGWGCALVAAILAAILAFRLANGG